MCSKIYARWRSVAPLFIAFWCRRHRLSHFSLATGSYHAYDICCFLLCHLTLVFHFRFAGLAFFCISRPKRYFSLMIYAALLRRRLSFLSINARDRRFSFSNRWCFFAAASFRFSIYCGLIYRLSRLWWARHAPVYIYAFHFSLSFSFS